MQPNDSRSITITEYFAIRLIALLPTEVLSIISTALLAEADGPHGEEVSALATHMRVARRLRDRAAADPERYRGLYEKYIVHRADGASGVGRKHEHCRQFVLDLDHDPIAAPCLSLYAEIARASYPELASDLRKLLSSLP